MINKIITQSMLVWLNVCLVFVGQAWADGEGVDQGENVQAIEVAPHHVPGELIVKFGKQPGPEIMADVETVLGGNVQWRALRHAPHAKGMPDTPHPLSKYRIATVDPKADVSALSRQVAALPGIVFASVNNIPQPTYTPNDPLFSDQWSHQKISSQGAWDISIGSSDIIVAIIDTGCLINHEDLEDSVWANDDPPNGVDDDNNGFIDDTVGWDFVNNNNTVDDVFGHGTQVSGISSAGIDNGLGIAGIANATIMTVKWWHQSGSDSTVAESVYYATDNGAHVLNLSLNCQCLMPLTEDAVNYAHNNGAVVVAAAGNAGTSSPGYPGAYPNVIAVCAIDINDQLAGFSNYGSHLDVGAPSPGILSTSPQGSTLYDSGFGGTSAASPHVAGLAALVLSVDPSLSPDEVRAVINENADDLGAPGFDNIFGNGRINCAATIAALTPSDVPADDYTVLRGLYVTGDLEDTFSSDDSYLKFQPGITLSATEPPVWIEFEGTLPSDSPGELAVTLEASANSVGITQTIEMFNWNAGQYEEVDSRSASLNNDSVATIDLTDNIADYVETGTGNVKTRTGWRATGIVFIFPWTICIDQVIWAIGN